MTLSNLQFKIIACALQTQPLLQYIIKTKYYYFEGRKQRLHFGRLGWSGLGMNGWLTA